MHIHIIIHDDDEFCPRHLPRAPDRVHHPAGLQWIRLANLDERTIVEAPKHRQVVILDVVNQRAQ